MRKGQGEKKSQVQRKKFKKIPLYLKVEKRQERNFRGNEIKDKDILSLQVKFWAYPQSNPHMKANRNKREKHLITE